MRLTIRVKLRRGAGDGDGDQAWTMEGGRRGMSGRRVVDDNQPGGASYKGSQSRKKRSIVGMTRRCGKAGNKQKINKKDGTGRMTERGKETTDKPLPISVSTHLVHVHSHCHTTRNIYINHASSLHFAFQCLKRSGLGYASRSTEHFSGGRLGCYVWRLVGSILDSKSQKNTMRTGAI